MKTRMHQNTVLVKQINIKTSQSYSKIHSFSSEPKELVLYYRLCSVAYSEANIAFYLELIYISY